MHLLAYNLFNVTTTTTTITITSAATVAILKESTKKYILFKYTNATEKWNQKGLDESKERKSRQNERERNKI